MPTRRLPKEIATNHEKAVRAEYSRHWQAGWTAVMRCRARCAALRDDLVRILGDKQVLHRVIDLVRYAADASPYRLVPQVVVLPRTTADVANVLTYCRENGRHATLRAAGTSLNGQSQSDDILIDVSRNWSGCSVEDGGGLLLSRPGTILAHAFANGRGRLLGYSAGCTLLPHMVKAVLSGRADEVVDLATTNLWR
jgi:hypothetical protein